ncbi:hypothetical protein [Demequina sp. NBRC 110055]|uniref:hypothetical protein n=1 Tax=Demequina sp. NBRC 110055 TaxID=1570344 RepID=UPI001185DE59|nr:hypothetical protein [Demequina sp. NBRC 110055]
MSIVAAGMALAACDTTDEALGEAQAGFGVPRQPDDAPIEGERTDISGVVRVRGNDCVDLEVDGLQRWAVWPADSGAVDGGAMPELDGVAVDAGDGITGTGALVTADALPDWGGDGYFAAFGGFCDADKVGVVVLDHATISPRRAQR